MVARDAIVPQDFSSSPILLMLGFSSHVKTVWHFLSRFAAEEEIAQGQAAVGLNWLCSPSVCDLRLMP